MDRRNDHVRWKCAGTTNVGLDAQKAFHPLLNSDYRDVANEQSLDAGLARIHESMPPIGGVAFGPLVLKDILFKNMDLDMMETVLEPKVRGANLLNERLCDSDNPLDFFVMFSSFVMVCGNPGQSAYSAANAYTHSLAQQRRTRGLAVSGD